MKRVVSAALLVASVAGVAVHAAPASFDAIDTGATATEPAQRFGPSVPLDRPHCPFAASWYVRNSGDFGNTVLLHNHDGDSTDDPRIEVASERFLPTGVELSYDCTTIFVLGSESLRAINIATGAVTRVSAPGPLRQGVVVATTRGLASWDTFGPVKVLTVPDGRTLEEWDDAPNNDNGALSRDGRVFALVAGEGINVYRSGEIDPVVISSAASNITLDVSPAGTRLLSRRLEANGASEIRVYSAAGQLLRSFVRSDSTNARFLDESTIVTCEPDGMYRSVGLADFSRVEVFQYQARPSEGGPVLPWSPAAVACGSAS